MLAVVLNNANDTDGQCGRTRTTRHLAGIRRCWGGR